MEDFFLSQRGQGLLCLFQKHFGLAFLKNFRGLYEAVPCLVGSALCLVETTEIQIGLTLKAVSYTHLTLPTTPYV